MVRRFVGAVAVAFMAIAASGGTGAVLGATASAEGGTFAQCFYCDNDCCKLRDGVGAMACASGVSYPNCGSWCSIADQDPCPESFDLVYGIDGVAARAAEVDGDATAAEEVGAPSAVEFRTCTGILLGRYYGAAMEAHLERSLERITL